MIRQSLDDVFGGNQRLMGLRAGGPLMKGILS